MSDDVTRQIARQAAAALQPTPVDRPSEYHDIPASEIFCDYWCWYRRVLAIYLVGVIAIGVAALVALWLDLLLGYFVGLAAIVAVAFVLQGKVNRRFARLTAILNTDCDVAKWRAVIEQFQAHTRRKRPRRNYALYLAVADFEDCRPADALARTQGLHFSTRNPQSIALHQARALYANEVGDLQTRDAELEALRALCTKGSKAARALVRDQVESLELAFRPHGSWGEKDREVMERFLSAAKTHRERVAWKLRLAEYALSHGGAAQAAELLDERRLSPMTLRAARQREKLAALLGTGNPSATGSV